ncbi:MAG: XRE family transcriptional regulator [Desulfarculaceae bacterium]|nr:XRE family transcriptional regulator [Desulfarculaceae bacterium]MCF8071832.1 XRE family transcriptional regulator [Desulfarculaceae bacterium]MCF8101382.1 XRE family transcriptional regulator [Desulfarculaceae bacterium]MCF8117157.1 XRE family transcriptional regulator [Desulfarculaceae bacterium]
MARKVKPQSLGQRIGRLRERQEISLDTLANMTGQSVETLAQIEKDEKIPPVALLLTLSRALEVDSGELLKDEEEAEAAERRVEAVKVRTDRYSYRVLTPEAGHRHLKSFLVTIDPSSDLEGAGYQHEGEEFVYVLSGEVEVQVGQNVNRLTSGDSLHFNSSLVHTLKNPGTETTELLVVLYTP